MSGGTPGRGRGRYGIDGGGLAVAFLAGVQAGLASLALRAALQHKRAVALVTGTASVAVAGTVAGYLYSTGPGKLAVWTELLDELGLRGDEQVLDVGCGRGAVLILAARRLPRGRAVGIDIWRRIDQSGNSRAATLRNAAVEGVADRVNVVDGDARDLPFPADSFDVVVSSLALNNIRGTAGREQALFEAVRVLRPGGRLRIVDDRADLYAAALRAAGCTDVATRPLDWRTSFGVPGHHMHLVTAVKPPGASPPAGARGAGR